MEVKQVDDLLRALPPLDSAVAANAGASIAAAKADALGRRDEAEAKRLWCLEQVLRARNQYREAFHLLKSSRYYDAWCELERLELTLQFLRPHFGSEFHRYHLDFISTYCRRWQGLFPYKMFMSPELIEHEKKCSICGDPVSIRNPCGHRVGEIYGGEMCVRIVTNAEFLGTAFVESPVQKYSVPFMVDPESGESRDHYNYSVVRYAAERLSSPFHEWDVEWTTRRQPHERFPNVGRNDKCPCESGRKYKKCCLRESGVLRPHVEFVFHVPPAHELLRVEYSDEP